jgi:hypothetical protein
MHGASVSALLAGVIGLICVTQAVGTAGADSSIVKLPQDITSKGSREARNTSRFSATLPSPACTSTASNFYRG